jgi:hypothetical protein
MYNLYYLLFNTVYIKNSPTCFELGYSSSSGTQLFITPAIYVWYEYHESLRMNCDIVQNMLDYF